VTHSWAIALIRCFQGWGSSVAISSHMRRLMSAKVSIACSGAAHQACPPLRLGRPVCTPARRLSEQLLADLHAANVPAELAERLWQQVVHDPAAVEYLMRLGDVTLALSHLPTRPAPHPMPAAVRQRLDRLLCLASTSWQDLAGQKVDTTDDKVT
jgi:hypothetical protein